MTGTGGIYGIYARICHPINDLGGWRGPHNEAADLTSREFVS